MAKTGKGVTDRIWDFLASVKLAIVLFSLIALTSVVGTVLEQQAEPERNIKILAKFFGDGLAPSLYGVLEAAGFLDMYHSWWFVAFLLLFAVNLLICSIDRFPPIWKAVREPIRPLSEEAMRGIPIKRELVLKGSPDKVRGMLGTSGFKLVEAGVPEGAGPTVLMWERGRRSRLGVFVTHISIILILIGAIIGIFLGFKAQLNLPEGASYPFAFMRVSLSSQEINERGIVLDALQKSGGNSAQAAASLGVPEGQLNARMRTLGIVPLGFSVRCDDFDVSFYGKSDMPKDYRSRLTVIDGGREVMSKEIEVNDPLVYRGITFYQSSYGVSGGEHVEFVLKATSKGGLSETAKLHAGESFRIPGTDIGITVKDWSPALSFDQSGRPYTYSETMNNPSAQVEIDEGGRKYSKWLMKRYPDTWQLANGHIVELVDVWGAQYTGLQVRRDPGVWVVYLGCILMSVGLFVAFFISHRRLWVSLSGEKGATRVLVAATANKGREAFERKVDKMVSLLREGGK
jgi:cytochrome c biogenesis protein